jgi:phosphotransferase system HPr (HPr) family protein
MSPTHERKPMTDNTFAGRGVESASPHTAANTDGAILRRQVTITNPTGLHLRPIVDFIQMASQFASRITLARGEVLANGKSPLDLMLLGANEGAELTLEVSGQGAPAALPALLSVLSTVARSRPQANGGDFDGQPGDGM